MPEPEIIEVMVEPPVTVIEVKEVGPQGPEGPPGEGGEIDIPDLSLLFENNLV